MADYISKDSAIFIFNAKAEMAVCTPAQPYFAKAAKMIELLPAADVAPVVHGRWVPFLDGDSIMPERYYRCSRCGRIERQSEPYCNCGAKMDLK